MDGYLFCVFSFLDHSALEEEAEEEEDGQKQKQQSRKERKSRRGRSEKKRERRSGQRKSGGERGRRGGAGEEAGLLVGQDAGFLSPPPRPASSMDRPASPLPSVLSPASVVTSGHGDSIPRTPPELQQQQLQQHSQQQQQQAAMETAWQEAESSTQLKLPSEVVDSWEATSAWVLQYNILKVG